MYNYQRSPSSGQKQHVAGYRKNPFWSDKPLWLKETVKGDHWQGMKNDTNFVISRAGNSRYLVKANEVYVSEATTAKEAIATVVALSEANRGMARYNPAGRSKMSKLSNRDKAALDRNNVEIFHVDGAEARSNRAELADMDKAKGKRKGWHEENSEHNGCIRAGWYYWQCFPGYLPEGSAMGPFTSFTAAANDCIESWGLYEQDGYKNNPAMSTPVKAAIGVGVLAAIGGAAWYFTKK